MARRWQAHPQRDGPHHPPVSRLGLMVLLALVATLSAPSLSAILGRDGSRPEASATPAVGTMVGDAGSDAASAPAGTATPALVDGATSVPYLAQLAALAGPPQAVDAGGSGTSSPSKISPPAAGQPARRSISRGSKVVFLGDSYTSGWNGAGIGARGWPRLVASSRGWHAVNLAVPGTGFMDPGWTGTPVGSVVGSAIDRHPDAVVVAAGHNDYDWSRSATLAAAGRVISRIHRSLPHAILVVIGPIWQNGRPPAALVALRDHLRRIASAVGALFIDPIAERWFAGSRHALIGADGIHPTDRGHRFMAAQVLNDLARNRD